MRIESITLRNYKRFVSEKKISFNDDITLIVGNNGSGKTSILQAIVSILATATQELTAPSKLNWSGYNYELLKSSKMSPVVDAKIHFDQDEIKATQAYFKEIKESRSLETTPGSSENILLKLEYEKDIANAASSKNFFQFRGYSYAKQLVRLRPLKSYFENVGNVFWYTETRDNNSFKLLEETGKENAIREFLISRYRFHQRIKYEEIILRDDQRDIYEDLAKSYSQVFPGRSLQGSMPRGNFAEAFEPDWFYLSDGTNQYEISEMSAGERAIFPILVDFANFRINNSIIIIDEIELHLHPPLQQAFYRALPSLGKNNQFIITTHSDYIASIEDESKIVRL